MKCNDPLNCFMIALVLNGIVVGVCAAGYWNLDRKLDTLTGYMLQHNQPRIESVALNGKA